MPVANQLYDRLVKIVGQEYITGELCDRLVYAKDYSIEGIAGDYTPDIVVKPSSSEEIIDIVKTAIEFDVPIYTWGGGTSMSGNPLAVHHGIVLDMKRMNRIIEVDPANLTITVQSGATMAEVQAAARNHDVFFTHQPESCLSSTIGGALSCMGISIFGAKYGYAFDQVLEMEVIVGTGETYRIGGKSYLSVASHNLLNLFLGAEGTLGIITEATLKVYPLPKTRKHISYGFPNITSAMDACKRVHASGCWPETVYAFDKRSLVQYMERSKTPTPDEVKMAILFGCSGDEDVIDAMLKAISRCCDEYNGELLPEELTDSWWKSVNINRDTFDQSNFALSHTEYEPDLIDACVPFSKFQEYSDFCDDLKKEFGWVKIDFGAFIVAGPRGPIPFAIYLSVPIDTREPREIEKWFEFKERMYRKALDMGGSVSDANGIGLRSAPWVREQLGAAWTLLTDIKQLLDPNNILNRGQRGFE